MSIIYLLIPIAMIFVTVAVILFFWAVKSNQYDDLDREGINILFDEEPPVIDVQNNKNEDKNNSDKTDSVADHAKQ